MWNLKQGWKNIFAFNCLSLCSEVSPFAAEAGLRVIASFLWRRSMKSSLEMDQVKTKRKTRSSEMDRMVTSSIR